MYEVKLFGVKLPYPVPDEVVESLYSEMLKKNLQENIRLTPISSETKYKNVVRKDSSHYILIPKQWIEKLGNPTGFKLEFAGDTIIITPL